MALDPATVTKIERRWGAQYIAQLTLREEYTNGDSADEDVLEVAVNSAQTFVQERCGPTVADEDNDRVVAIVPYFLLPPGAALKSDILAEWNDVYGKMQVKTAAVVTTAVDADSADSRRRFTGDDYYADLVAGQQRGYRPARGSW